MLDLDAFWLERAGPLGLAATRPDFRLDPSFPAARAPAGALKKGRGLAGSLLGAFAPGSRQRAPLDRPKSPTNLYQLLRLARPALPGILLGLLTPGPLRDALAAGQEGAAELAFELMILPQGIDREISDFSAEHYLGRYPEVAEAGFVALVHYIDHGLAEGRVTLGMLRQSLLAGDAAWVEGRSSVLVVVHEMSTTGAPIVGLQLVREAAAEHNVIVLSLRGGPLLEPFRKAAAFVAVIENPLQDAEAILGELLAGVEFALLNSAETAPFVPLLVAREIPFCAYVHEYAQYCLPAYKTVFLSGFAELIVYSSDSVRDTWRGVHLDTGFDTRTQSIVVPQAPLEPRQIAKSAYEAARARLSQMLGFDLENRKLVYCAGSAHWRKGTDLFVMTAQMAHRMDPGAVFLLIGDGLNHEDIHCGIWLEKHLQEAGANLPGGYLFAIPAGPAYGDVCAGADIMMLASRLDPLPNVVLDGVRQDCDIVLFDHGSGFDDAQYRQQSRLHRVGFGLLDEAARLIVALPTKKSRASWAPEGAEETAGAPAMPLFRHLAGALGAARAARRRFTLGKGEFDASMLFSSGPANAGRREAERLQSWNLGRKVIWKSQAEAEAALAASSHAVHRTIRLLRHSDLDGAGLPPFSLHLHAYYTEDLAQELSAYAAFRAARRIVVTTDTAAKADLIADLARKADLRMEILQVPNQGRDILPFLRLFHEGSGIGQDGIWGHLHLKKSPDSGPGGDAWRRFLLRILLGDAQKLSNALEAMRDPVVGLVAPFDPQIVGWYGSRRLLPAVAGRIGLPLPDHPLLFPVGNMFWTRPEVVRKMIGYFGESFPFPNEPIASDGTVYHLIERLWSIAAADTGLGSVYVSKPDQPRR